MSYKVFFSFSQQYFKQNVFFILGNLIKKEILELPDEENLEEEGKFDSFKADELMDDFDDIKIEINDPEQFTSENQIQIEPVFSATLLKEEPREIKLVKGKSHFYLNRMLKFLSKVFF